MICMWGDLEIIDNFHQSVTWATRFDLIFPSAFRKRDEKAVKRRVASTFVPRGQLSQIDTSRVAKRAKVRCHGHTGGGCDHLPQTPD